VNITVMIRNSMMSTMMSNPPQRPALRCTGTKPGSYELGDSPGFEGVVAEFSMIKAGDSEASHYVHHN